jgi:hypothetical protein
MIKRMWLVMALLLGLVCMLSALPAGADIPTNLVDQYWYWDTSGWHKSVAVPNTGFDQPVWNPGGATGANGLGFDVLWLDNKFVPDRVKEIWVEVKWVTPQNQVRPITVADPNGVVYTPWRTWIGSLPGSPTSQFTTAQFRLTWQPDWEYIRFDSTDYYNLNGIEVVEVGSRCVPEPMSVMLGILGLSSIVGFRKLRKK